MYRGDDDLQARLEGRRPLICRPYNGNVCLLHCRQLLRQDGSCRLQGCKEECCWRLNKVQRLILVTLRFTDARLFIFIVFVLNYVSVAYSCMCSYFV